MSDTPQRNNLGRGLAALFAEDGEDFAELDRVRAAKDVPIEQIRPNPRQPRQVFDDKAVAELSESIKANGVLQPILVRRHPERTGEFEIVAGERRWRAAQLAKLHEVPIVIRDVDDGQALEMALVENIQRQDLNALEEAEAYQRLVDEFGHSQEKLGGIVGKSRSHVANTLRLLGLPDEIKAMLLEGSLSAGHARALLGTGDPITLARRIVAEAMSVRQAEELAGSEKPAVKSKAKRKGAAAPSAKDPDTVALERDLTTLLGLKVTIDSRGESGRLSFHYLTLEQLDGLLQRLDLQGG